MKRTNKPKTLKEIKHDTKKLSNGSDLSERHKKFAERYIFDWNATAAYKVAYPGVVHTTAGQNGHQLLKNTKIQDYIEEIQKDIAKMAGISRLKVAQEYAKIAFSSIRHLHDTWLSRKEWDEISDDQKDAISEIIVRRTEDGDEVKVKLYDKKAALDALTKYFGFAEPEKIMGMIAHTHTIKQIPVKELSPNVQEMLLEVGQKQLTDGVRDN